MLLVIPAMVMTWAFRPGYMNADTLRQYGSTQGLGLDDWYAPVIQLLWDGALRIGIGRPTFVLFAQCLAILLGTWLVLRHLLPRVRAAVAAVMLFALPPVFCQAMLLGRDTWLVAFTVLQAGLAIRSSHATTLRACQLWIAGSFACAFLAIATRQNAAAVTICLLASTALRARSRSTRRRPRRVSLVGCAFALVATVSGMTMAFAVQRVAGVKDARPEVVLFAYDLTGMSLRSGELLLGPVAFPAQDLNVLRSRWYPDDVVPLVLPTETATVLAYYGPPEAADELANDWLHAVQERPATYLAVRGSLFLRLIGVTSPPHYVMHLGVDRNDFGFRLANPAANRFFRSYVNAFSPGRDFANGSYLFRPWPYLVAAAAAASFLFSRRRWQAPGALEVAWLAVGALLYEASFFVLAPGHGYRYSYPPIVFGIVATTFAVITWVRDRASAPTIRAPSARASA